ncbi:Ima1 N-terminal domain-containing protein [Paraphoma chrysanthemicola]|nr:Ima1 N-terminal domain-containing protein [Paraphoma chrysanthemicola]
MALLRRRIRCHYCNQQSPDTVTQMPRRFHCPHCDATNYYDKLGNLTDPPAQVTAAVQPTSFHQIPSRSPSPVMSAAPESPFCSTCERNQALVQNLIAEYLPEEDDPKYAEYEAGYENYRVELEQRYPQVCVACEARVNEQIQKAGYAARADHVRRIMERSERKRTAAKSARQAWTLRLISLAKWAYIASVFVQLLWHIFGYMMAVDERLYEAGDVPVEDLFSWKVCALQAYHTLSVDESCVMSTSVIKVVFYALCADALTVWWNPRLQEKTNSITGRMRGLKSLWAIRGFVFMCRVASVYYWRSTTIDPLSLSRFQTTHTAMAAIMLLSLVLTWTIVRVEYHAPPSFRRSANEQVASVATTPEKVRRSSYHPAHPEPTMFDSMAHSFVSGFDNTQDGPALPPSPTLTNSSYTTHGTEATTPFGNKSSRGADDMDWTPTQRRFAAHQPTVHPSPWSARQPSPPPQYTEPVSIFSKPDPNPFHHRVPAVPKAPAHAKADPWRRGVWAPPLKETVPNFFQEDKKMRGGVGETKGLDGLGVPKNVKRDAELFASPKLKYDYYGTMKQTGLEDRFEETFNDFFTK